MGYMAALSRFFAVVGVPANNTHAANQSLGILLVVCRWRGRQQRQGAAGDSSAARNLLLQAVAAAIWLCMVAIGTNGLPAA